jgi:N-acetylmuramoyl-L-alanine amidase
MRLAIDPGHGWQNRRPGQYDPGACSGGHCEADVVLQWALSGRWVLGNLGIATWLTRDDDRDSDPVSTRDDRAELAGCTKFISLHCNSANPGATGTETFYRDSADKVWAQKVQDAAIHALGLRNRGLKTEAQSQHPRLAVFDFDGPACLLELGFITNAVDRQAMLKRERRIAFWQKLAEDLL